MYSLSYAFVSLFACRLVRSITVIQVAGVKSKGNLVLVVVVALLVLVHHGEKRKSSVTPRELLDDDSLVGHLGEICI